MLTSYRCVDNSNNVTEISLKIFVLKVSNYESIELDLHDLDVPLRFELFDEVARDLIVLTLVHFEAHRLQQTLTSLEP